MRSLKGTASAVRGGGLTRAEQPIIRAGSILRGTARGGAAPAWRAPAWVALHLLLGVALRASPAAALAHGVIVTGAAVVAGAAGRMQSVLGVIVYAAASQVLWRMSGAPLPHMLGMYVVIAAAGVAALRMRRRPPLEAFAFFLPLLPSCALTVLALGDWKGARQLLAFNLAGPAALFAVLWLLRGRDARLDIWKLVGIGLGPLAGIATAALWYMRGLGGVEFGTQSNFAASGGFGPNQVASALSLGIVLLVAVLWLRGGMGRTLWVWGLLAFLTVQALLTFSRSGIAMALGAAAAMGLILLRAPGARAAVALFALLAWVAADRVLVPWLNRYTGGAFVERYTDPRLSNRDVIAKSDLEMFLDHPVLGVGPGMGTELRESLLGQRVAAHTEFTRMLGEHGLGGVLALVALALVSVRAVRGAPPGRPRALPFGLVAWMWLYFAVNAFRTVLPVAALALALASSSTRSVCAAPAGQGKGAG
ncbi:MAG: O-antigen ligase family protein [Candidatus Bipolaricaulota bacterium]